VTSRKSLTLLVLFLGSWPATAAAYCRTRTCDVDNDCEIGDDGCSMGIKTRWSSGCITFSIQRDGSALEGISADATRKVAEDAFALWTDTECHRGGSPPLTFIDQGQVTCHQVEYNCNPEDWNSNVIMFQDEAWAHSSSALAITCVTLNLDTGEILDADIELNSPAYDFALPGEASGSDLRTVLTHEVGHLLGLSHSQFGGAVMVDSYQPNVILSSLSDDDIAGVCAIYGGDEDDPECKTPELPDDTECVGSSDCVPIPQDPGCSCREGAPSGAGNTTLLSLFAVSGLVGLRRRRSRALTAVGARGSACR